MAKNMDYSKYVAAALVIAVTYLGFVIVRPVIIPLIFSVIFAYISHPLYKRIRKYIKSDSWSAFLVALLIIIVISLPVIFIMNTLVSQTQVVYALSRQAVIRGNIFTDTCVNQEGVLCNLINSAETMLQNPKIKYYLDDGLNKISTSLIQSVTSFIFEIPKRVLDFFIMLFAIFYLLMGGERLILRIKSVLPLKKKDCNILFTRMKDVFYAMIYGYFLVALLQGFLATIAYFAVGINGALLWGLVTAVAALLPMFGTSLVWVPASAYLVINGLLGNDPSGIWKGVGLFIYCLTVVGTVDNILRPKLVSQRADIHPLVVLIGIIGGLSVFGFVGLIIGPIILGIIITLFSMYEKTQRGKTACR